MHSRIWQGEEQAIGYKITNQHWFGANKQKAATLPMLFRK